MRVLLFFCIISLSSVSAIWTPRYDPCQIDNPQCSLGDFQVGENFTTCRTVARDNYGWNTRKSCIAFVQDCSSVEDLAEVIYHRIDCTTITDANIKEECEKWKVTEYCVINWFHTIVAFVVFFTLAAITLYCVFGVGKKSDAVLRLEEKEAADALIEESGRNPGLIYKRRIRRF